MLEHLLYYLKGLGWGVRWAVINADKNAYLPFFPVYSVDQLLVREFLLVLRYFGGRAEGVLALTVYILLLGALLVMLWRTSSLLLRALAVFGLTTWGFFAFAIVDVADGKIRAVTDPVFRYFQPFFYTAVIALCWLTWRGYVAVTRQLSGETLRRGINVGLALSLLCFVGESVRLSVKYTARLTRPDGELWQTVQVLDRAAEAVAPQPLAVYSSPGSLRVISLFRGSWSRPPILWKSYPVGELAPLVQQRTPTFVLRDEIRESSDLRHKKSRYQNSKAASIEKEKQDFLALQQALWQQYEPFSAAGRYVLYRVAATLPPTRLLPNGDFHEADVDRKQVPAWSLSSAAVKLSRSAAGRLTLSEFGTLPVLFYSGNASRLSVPPADARRYPLHPGSLYTFRVVAQFAEGMTVQMRLFQYDGARCVAERRFILESGENYLAVRPAPTATSYRVGLEIGTKNQLQPSVEVVEVSVREYPQRHPS
jgi:hypothetical protein